MKQRIFVFEFITGGGWVDQPLPASLLREGTLMLDALLRDAEDLPDTEVVTLRDSRLPGLDDRSTVGLADNVTDCITITNAGDFEAGFVTALDRCDAAIMVAPETGGVLASLADRVEASGRLLLGCDAETCRIAGSKSRTADHLARNGIAVLPHYADPDGIDHLTGSSPGRWVVKPDDGAGCDGLQIVDGPVAAACLLRARGSGHIAQPWFAGEARSMNLLCDRGKAVLLSVNRQFLKHDGDRVSLAALGVGDVMPDAHHAALAARIAAALPGLLGHVGVDLLHTEDGPLVVEINPRFSTSACALRSTLGLNLLAATLAAIRGQPLPHPHPHAGIGSMNIDLANPDPFHDEIY
jgi:predicted ATP-grasp superfamily ATP-dependent carboligase